MGFFVWGESAFYALILHLLVGLIGGLSKTQSFSTSCVVIHYYSALCTLGEYALYLTLQHQKLIKKEEILMKKKTFAILFYVKRTKLLKNGEAPIFMRITVDALRAEISIQRSINLSEWIENKGCAKPTNAKNRELQPHPIVC
ncbi:MAG: hypothetical protein LBE79_10880 [Tannerella sp.]|jgi:hypothetical protein|nr:hypothetical protein [Tannerella sp.]